MTPEEIARLVEENDLLRQEVRVAREAANLTASVVVRQFEETERVLTRLSDVSAEQRAVLDAASQVLVVATDRRGTIRVFNTGAERMLGWRASEIVGKATPVAFHLEEELAAVASRLEPEAGRPLSLLDVFFVHAETGRSAAREYTLVRKDGSQVPVDEAITALRGPSGDLLGFLCVALDLTVHKRAQQEIRAAMEATEAANRTKSAFLANMSHELRTPLNAIIGYSEMLMEEAEDEGLEPFTTDLGKIQSAGQHLLGLINDILDISKIESGKIELFIEDVVVADLVGEVARMAVPLADKNENDLVVKAGDAGVMRADALRVRQILFNLLSNAAKFTDHGKITLAVEVEPGPEGDVIAFHVSDTGIGMSEDQLEKLFQPFVQADASTTRKFGGTGLGLAISRQFAELMGGRVDVESALGRGTTFSARIPRVTEKKKAEPTLAAPAATPARGARNQRPVGPWDPDSPTMPFVDIGGNDEPPAFDVARTLPDGVGVRGRVLVIDDDASVRELLGRYLERGGFQVSCATTGDEGVLKARQERPDVVTLDVLMPDKDGWMVLADLKSDPQTSDIPVVMLTILDQRNAGYALGAADYLVKPVDRTRLMQVLERHLPVDLRRRTALVVDDDADLRKLLVGALAREGFEAREAENGKVALDAVAEALPSVILLDLMMPIMDGFVFLEHLRARPEWRNVPVIVVTAMDLSRSDRMLLNGRVAKVVEKGAYNNAALLDEVQRLVEQGLARRRSDPGEAT